MKIAIIGTQGVPAAYGGLESLVENLLRYKQSDEVAYTVYCSSRDLPTHLDTYCGAKLRYIPLHANGIQSIPYDIIAMLRALRKHDTLLILGTSGCLFIPILRLIAPKKRIIVNIDGVEHRRDKWGRIARWILRHSEKIAVHHADTVIADNPGIIRYVREQYHRDAEMIAYGGDHAIVDVSETRQQEILQQHHLTAGTYGISVCRIEPENNCHLTLQAFAETGKPLLFVGNWQRSDYSRELYQKYSSLSNIHLLDATYDLETLYTLRHNAAVYVHGHSAGGTNPSLVEAMFFGRPILAFDVIYNRETTHNLATYYSDLSTLKSHLLTLPTNGAPLLTLARTAYPWSRITLSYETLYKNMLTHDHPVDI